MENNRIKYALYLPLWRYGVDSKNSLKENAERIPPNEYTELMENHIYCPECCVSLYRSPKERQVDKRGRPAFYSHVREPSLYCSLRVNRSTGKQYDNEEQAAEAIENEELLIVQGFMQENPVTSEFDSPLNYQNLVEDRDGEPTEVAISRHDGKSFKLPTKITTIRGLCRNFDKNYYKYIVLQPNMNSALTLGQQLVDIRTVNAECDIPKLYFGVIKESFTPSPNPGPHNIRMTTLKYSNNKFKDFILKTKVGFDKTHGINNETKDRFVLMYGTVTESGIGLCIEHVGWGEFALLPKKYEYLLNNS